MTLTTVMTVNYRGSLNRAGHSPEMGDVRWVRNMGSASVIKPVAVAVPLGLYESQKCVRYVQLCAHGFIPPLLREGVAAE